MHAITLRIRVRDEGINGLSWITDSLGEAARELEVHEAEKRTPPLGLVPDPDDPGRFAWEIVVESYAP